MIDSYSFLIIYIDEVNDRVCIHYPAIRYYSNEINA
ncbi:hypothetical protein L950_0201975 [Sphingobacterium sp. IITKGP-BTPF85]|nr:hypothetical protein L950_0201975 [Sphingobacterium sp. IITKGP-BTPF85]